MNTYRYRVSDNKGRIKIVTKQAHSYAEAESDIMGEGLFPVIMETGGNRRSSLPERISVKKLAELTSILSMLLDSGLGITDAVSILGSITTDRKTADFVSLVEEKMQAGRTFSSAFEESVSSLPSIYMLLVKTGEVTGNLKESFKNLDKYLMRTKSVKDKLVSSSIYPLFVIFTALAGMILVSTFIIPKISELFYSLGADIPEAVNHALIFSRLMLTVSGIILPAAVPIIILVHTAEKRWNKAAYIISRVKNGIPIAGSFIRDTRMLQILLSLDALVSCGISIEESLKMTADAIKDGMYKDTLLNLRREIMKGESLSAAMSRERMIPRKVRNWTAACERTGDPESAFRQLASFYEKEIDKKASIFIGIIEPVLILITGFFIMLMIIFIITPLFNAFGGIAL